MLEIGEHTLPIGVAASGVTHSTVTLPSLRSRVRMARDTGVFDFINRSPIDGEYDEIKRASNDFGLPVLAGTSVYIAGRDEPLFARNMERAQALGTAIHDVQLMAQHDDGHQLRNDEVADTYLRFYDIAARFGVTIGFEVHINMWSEHCGRVCEVAERVERRGIPFSLTFDPSHVIFKIDNPDEQRVQNMDRDIASGRLVLDPSRPDNVMQRWIEANYVVHCHARAAVPRNPVNVWARHPDGSFGRGVQYPFVLPRDGEWHSEWSEALLEPWKSSLRALLNWHSAHAESRLRAVTCEFIPAVDYGGGARYSILQQNVACARWLRQEYPHVFGQSVDSSFITD